MRYIILMLAMILSGTAEAAKQARNSESSDSDNTSVSRSSGSLTNGNLEMDPAFGFAFISPKDVNSLIRDNNDSLQKQGVKSFSADEIGSTTYFGLATTYRVIPQLGLGLGFHHLGTSSEASAKINEQSINGKYDVSANFLTAESRISVFGSRRNRVEGVLSPFVGVGFYKASSSFTGSAMQNGSTEINSSASGVVFGTTASARYWFTPNLAAGLTTGYRFAKSGNLKIDSQKNTDQGVGSTVENGGKKVILDASSFMIGAALTWAI